MGLYITSLNSGSNGNCYYIGNDHEAVLIDAGISCRETEKRMKRLELSMDKIKAIFVSHEHGDHIQGIPVLAKKYELPVYITSTTLTNCNLRLEPTRICSFQAGKPVSIGGLSVTAFPKFHDAGDPHSFVVTFGNLKVGVFTDLGVVCKSLVKHFKQCHVAFLEANYDEKMLEEGSYPLHLKNRIRGGVGHLSNRQALQLMMDYKPAFMSHLLLSHLSKNNNDPALVKDLFSKVAGATKIIIASRDAETPVLHLNSPGSKNNHMKANNLQLSLFQV
ncbi:MAG: metallo-beta-lactamase [Chitinophagaceae bacterium]|nr:metallo-beta-lactamase [Chitinophagaceae bacterium]